LYRAARDELTRLDKENAELKDMLNTGVDTLTRSRWVHSLCGVGADALVNYARRRTLEQAVMIHTWSAATARAGSRYVDEVSCK
jgi:hypothetical protein